MKRIAAFFLCAALLLSWGAVRVLAEDLEAFDLNQATVEKLMAIPNSGISKELAEKIIEAAKKNPFKLPEDLLKVPGLDNEVLESINPQEKDGSLWYDPDAEMTLAPSKC